MGASRRVVRKHIDNGMVWEGQTQRVKSPYMKLICLFDAVPEYGGARETLSESGSTTIQG